MIDTVFETDRLVVRRWRNSDLTSLMAVYGDREAMKWVGDGQALTQALCAEWLIVTNRNYQKYGYGMFAVELKSESRVVGFCGIVHPGGQEAAECKYAYLRQFWGQGIASEALAGLIDYGVNTHGIRRMIATTAPQNIASHRVLLKSGMARGELRNNEDGSFTQVFEYTAMPTLHGINPDQTTIASENKEAANNVNLTLMSNTVRKALFQFDDAGRLVRLPNKLSIQQMTMWALWTHFAENQKYTEKEVNAIINGFHTFGDQATLRRELVNMKLLGRKSDCSEYWKESHHPSEEVQDFLRAWRAGLR